MNSTNRPHPIWETVVMIASFILLWVWILVRQHSPNGVPLLLSLLLVGAVVALIAIFVRRLRRVQRALRGESDVPIMPPRTPSSNGHVRKP